jgi:hypothetical protein
MECLVAVMNILRDMGFYCTHDGASGQKDVFVAAPIGTDSYKLIFEPKGTGENAKPIPNDKAEISGAASHIEDAGASHAVIVAREFAGFTKNPEADAQVLKECRTIKGDAASIMTVEALIELGRAMHKYHYGLDLLKPVFCEIEPPDKKLERIRKLNAPMDGFDYRGVLEEIWRRQVHEADGEAVFYGSVRQQNAVWKNAHSVTDFDARLQAIEALSSGRVILNTEQRTIYLKTDPEHLIGFIQARLQASEDVAGSPLPEPPQS